MDATTFDLDLQEALDDAAGTAYAAGALASAKRRALAAHATYRPRLMRVELALVAGAASYALPAGFLRPDAESLARALGGPGAAERVAGFRDGAFRVAAALSGTPAGMRAGWSAPTPFYGAPSSLALPVGTLLEFRLEDPPTLLVDPAPAAARALAFDGLFPHSIETCPESEREPLLCLCRAFCLEAKARRFGAAGKWSEGDASEDRASAAKSLLEQAEAARDEYRELVRMRPAVVTG